MGRWRRPALAWLVLAVYLLPAPALAQSTKAGVVTTLEGNVTAVRAVTPQPVPLKFKDDVYLQDRVVTGDQSFARLLLGGKAVISIRERSAVTITEIPGRSIVDIESGKIALSVARDRMQPGEVINIKTPNAVAGVRGTVVVADVTYGLGPSGAREPTSNLYVIRGLVEAVHTNAQGVPIGAPMNLGANQSLKATPTTATTGTFTLDQIGAIVAGLQGKGVQGAGADSQAPARAEAVTTATALLNALVGTTEGEKQIALLTGPPPQIASPDTQPKIGVDTVGQLTSSPVVPGGDLLPPPQVPQEPSTPVMFTLPAVFSGPAPVNVPGTSPLGSFTEVTIEQPAGGDLISILPDANVTLAGPLLALTDSNVQAGDEVLGVAGRLASTSSAPLISLDPTTVMAPDNIVEIVGPSGVVELVGAMLTDVGGTMAAGASILAISNGGRFTGTASAGAAPQPLIQLTGTTTSAGMVLSVTGPGSRADLTGSLLSTQGGSLTLSGLALADISLGGRVSSTSTLPFVNLIGTALALPESTFVVSGGQLSVGGSLLRAENIPSSTAFALFVDGGGSATVGGPVFDLINSINTAIGVRILVGGESTLTSTGGPLVRTTGGVLVSDTLVTADNTGNVLSLRGPVLDASNAIVTLARLFGVGASDDVTLFLAAGDPIVRLNGTILAAASANEPLMTRGTAAGPVVTQPGVSLIADGEPSTPSVVALNGSLLRLGAVNLTDPTAQVQLTNSAVIHGGTNPTAGLIEVNGLATVAGGLARLVDGALLGQGGPESSLVGVTGSLTSGPAPLIAIEGVTSEISGFQRLIGVDPGAGLALGGSALAMQEGLVAVGTVLGSASALATPAAATIVVGGGALTTTGSLVSATAGLTLGGSLLAQSGGIVTAGAPAASVTGAFTSGAAPVFQLTGGALSTPTAEGDLLRVTAGVANLGGSLLDIQNATVVLGEATLGGRQGGVIASLRGGSRLVQGAGPIVRMQGGSLVAGALLGGDGTGNTFALQGTVVDLTDAAFVLERVARFEGTDGSTLLVSGGVPLVRVTRSSLTVERGEFVSIGGDVDVACAPCPPAPVTSGVVLIASGTPTVQSHITIDDMLLDIGYVDFTGASPIVQLANTTVDQTGDGSVFMLWTAAGTRSTSQALLSAIDSAINTPGRAILAFDGGRLVSSVPSLLEFANSVVDAGWLVDVRRGQLELAGQLATFTGGSSAISNAVLRTLFNGQVIARSTSPLVGVAGGTHGLGTGIGMFALNDFGGGPTAAEVFEFRGSPPVTLQLGTHQPVRQDTGVLQAPLLSAANATIDTAAGLRLDTARLDTATRLFDFTNTTVTSGPLGFIDLVRSARLAVAIPSGEAAIRLVNSRVTVADQALARVRGFGAQGGSLLRVGTANVAGSIVSLEGGSALTLNHGPVLSVTDGGVAQIIGSLITFVGAGNTVTIDNNLCLAFICATVNGVRVALGAAVLASSVRIETDPITGLAGNTLVLGNDDALVLVDGVDSRLSILAAGVDQSDVIINGATVTLAANETLKTFTGTSNRPGVSAAIQITNSTVNGSASNLVLVEPGANATLQAGPLMKVTNSTLNALRLLLVQGSLTSLSASPLIALDPVTVNAQTLIEVAAGGSLTLTGRLLTDLNGTITTSGDVFSVAGTLTSTGPGAIVELQGTTLAAGAATSGASLFRLTGNVALASGLLETLDARLSADGFGLVVDGGTVTTAGTTAPLIKLTGTVAPAPASTVTTGNQFIRLMGATPATMSLSGPLLEAVRTTITTGNPTLNTLGLVAVHDGSTLTSPVNLLSLNQATLDLAGNLLSARRSPSVAAPSTVTLGDRLVRSVDSTVATTTLGFDATFGTTGSACCSVLSLQQGARLVATSDVPLFDLTRSTFRAGPDAQSGSIFFNISDTFNGAPVGELVAPSTMNLAGPMLVASDSTVSALFDLILVRRSTLTSTTTAPLVQLTGVSQMALGGANPLTTPPNGTSIGRLLNITGGVTDTINGQVGPGPALVSLAGPLLLANGATITTTGEIVGVNNGGMLTSLTALPLITLTANTRLTAGFAGNNADILEVGGVGGAGGTTPASVSLRGPLLATSVATNVNLFGRLVNVFDGGQLAVTDTTLPLVTFTGGTHVLGTNSTTPFNVSSVAGTPPSRIAVSGPLLAATQAASITIANPTTSTAAMLFVGDAGTLTSTTTLPLFSFEGVTYDAPNFMSIRRSRTEGNPAVVVPTTVALAGPLLTATDSTLTLGSGGNGPTSTCCTPFFVSQGARFSSTTTQALVQLVGTPLDNLDPVRSGSDIFAVTDTFTAAVAGETIAPAHMQLAGPLLTSTSNGPRNTRIEALFHLLRVNNSTLSSTTTNALFALSNGTLTLGGPNPFDSNNTTLARGLSLAGAGASIALQGPLFAFNNMTVTSTGELFGVFNSALLTSTTLEPLIQLNGPPAPGPRSAFTAGPNVGFMSISSNAGLSPTVQLAGPLLAATNAALRNGDPTVFNPQLSTLRAFTFIGDSAQVTSTSTQPLLDFDGSVVTTSGSLLSLRRSLTTATPTRLTLAGPLLRATNNSTLNVTSLALGSACCSAFDIDQAAELVSTSTSALIQLTSSLLNSGPDPIQSGGTLFLVTDAAGVSDGPVTAAPALVSLNGPLINSVNSKLTSLFSIVGVNRSTLRSTSPEALIQLNGFTGDLALQAGGVNPFVALPNNQSTIGRVLTVVSAAANGGVGPLSLVSLAGPLLSAVSAPIQVTGDVVGVFNGARVESTSLLPFLQLSGETTTLVAGAVDPGTQTILEGRVLIVSGLGGPDGVTPATVALSGPMALATNGSVVDTRSEGLSLLTDGALVTRAPPVGTYPLLSVDASSFSVGSADSAASAGRSGRLIEVIGAASPGTPTAPPLLADPQPNPVNGEPTGLQFGQQRPLQHNGGGALVEASNGGFVNVRGANGNVLRLDTALLDATAPLIALTGAGTRLQSTGNGIELVNNARLQSTNAPEGLIRLENQARMDVLNGHLVSVSASRLNVAGDLVRMGSNTLLNVNGVLLNVLAGGVVNINGALVAFTGVNGTINITNNLVPTSFIGGIPVSIAQGANVSIGAGALAGLNTNGNVIRINGTQLQPGAAITGSLISVGANGTVRVGGSLPN